MWFGRPSELPDIHERIDSELCEEVVSHESSVHTGGVRIYPAHRGRRLSSPLIQRSTHYYRRICPDAYMVIDIDSTNATSESAYKNCGYTLIGTGENKKTVEASDDPRLVYLERPTNKR